MFVSDSKPSWSPVRALRLVLLLGLLLGWDHFSDAHKVAKGNHAQDDAGVRTMQPRTSYIGVVDSFDKSKVAFSGGFKSPFRLIAEDGETSRSTASPRNAVHTVHTPPAASDEALGSTIPVSWTAAAGTDLVDVHICRDKVLDPSACVRVRSAMKAQKFGESGNSFTLRIGGEIHGGKKKSWQMPQEPCKLGLN